MRIYILVAALMVLSVECDKYSTQDHYNKKYGRKPIYHDNDNGSDENGYEKSLSAYDQEKPSYGKKKISYGQRKQMNDKYDNGSDIYGSDSVWIR